MEKEAQASRLALAQAQASAAGDGLADAGALLLPLCVRVCVRACVRVFTRVMCGPVALWPWTHTRDSSKPATAWLWCLTLRCYRLLLLLPAIRCYCNCLVAVLPASLATSSTAAWTLSCTASGCH